ncbi:retrotransposon-related protein [Tanacetum coccineum]
MMLIPLGGCEMVLGIQWLATLGDIVCNFLKLRMEFMYQWRKVAIRGVPQPALQWMQVKQLGAKLFSMALCVYPSSGVQAELMSTGITTDLTNVHPSLNLLLHKYEEVLLESRSPFSSPIVMVKKKDGTWRMCVDYSALNKKIGKDKFPIPIIEELIDELFGAQVFTKLDLRSGYRQIRMCEEDIHETAFRTHQGHYEFLVMPFGLTNAPSSFQALMNEVFAPILRKFVLVFFDDILVFSKDMEEHAKHLALVLNTMQSHQLFAKMSKCVFGTTQVEYLGHVISGAGVSTDPSKVKAMQEWPVPVNIKKLRGFLDLTGYYRRFVKNYAAISRPLTALLKKNSFEWSSSAQHAYEDLKVVMVNAPVLALPNFQEESLAPKDKGLSIYEKELWVVVYALENLQKGNENVVDDALSRSPLPSLQTMVIIGISNDLLHKIRASWELDPSIQQVINKVKDGPVASLKFIWQNNQLRRSGKLVIGADANLTQELLKFYHDEPLGGHSKPDLAPYPGLLQPLPIPTKIWTDISMDFIEGLPSSHRKTVIMVIINRLSKYGHFIPLSHPFKAAQIAQVFLDIVYKLHGLPKTITSDRDKNFIKVVNMCLECYLRCMTSEQSKEWVRWLSLAEFWYNTNYHTAINTTPFEVVYGQSPPTHVSYMAGDSHMKAVDRTLVAREAAIALLQFHLERTQQRMKMFADKNRSDRSFVVGDWVLLKLQTTHASYSQNAQATQVLSKVLWTISSISQVWTSGIQVVAS